MTDIITEADWKALHARDMEFANKTLINTGSVASMGVVYCANGPAIVTLVAMADDVKKQASFRALKLICIATDAIAFGFIGEAWIKMVTRQGDETPAEQKARALVGVRPSQMRDRIDVITTMIVYRDADDQRHMLSSIALIKRGDDGKPTGTEPMEQGDNPAIDDDIPNIFPAKRPTAEEQAAARIQLDRIVPGWKPS